MSGQPMLPNDLRAAIAANLQGVRPLPSAPRRLVWVAVCASALLGAVLLVAGLRPNAGALGPILLWGVTAAQLVAGLALAGLALREAIPGAGASAGAKVAALIGGALLQLIGSVACSAWTHGSPAAGFWHGDKCMGMEGLIALPALLVTLALVARAYAVRPGWAGTLGGAAAGLVADGTWRLVCPYCNLAHLLVWHSGAVALLALAGFAAGALTASLRARRAAQRASA